MWLLGKLSRLVLVGLLVCSLGYYFIVLFHFILNHICLQLCLYLYISGLQCSHNTEGGAGGENVVIGQNCRVWSSLAWSGLHFRIFVYLSVLL